MTPVKLKHILNQSDNLVQTQKGSQIKDKVETTTKKNIHSTTGKSAIVFNMTFRDNVICHGLFVFSEFS
jgi:hypothetical protein